ncbi:S8 family peptidase [Bacillus pinisoli]|uniref:S8 family peptidase n=1 Tax=Bacillus pinisoli TaxID=2901866 RepID=UPI001FF12A89|nr:S8 family serine peptidase [Bacillus pinisoli]
MKFNVKKNFKKVGIAALSMAFLMGSVTLPSSAATEKYTKVTELPETDGKIEQLLLPRGANKDELVEVIVQFEGTPLLKEYADAKAVGKKLDKETQRNHAKQLENGKKVAKDKVVKKGGTVIDSFENVYNGLYVQVKRSVLTELAELNEVKGIYAVTPVELHNDAGVPFIGAPEVWEKVVDGVNVTGEGITVAVIDTGIDYNHASFGGEGTVAAYEANDPNIIEEGSFPTAKVIGGYDFVGTDYDAGSDDPELRIPKPDLDPLDEQGHGSHVAATVAGLEVEGKVGGGVAPDALLYAYKVFGKDGSTGVTTQALEMAMDPNGDGDVSDHVDVVNMSLGSPYGHPEDPSAVATNLAVDAGIIVVASAGNSGNTPYITGSPAVAEKAISVAASVDDGVVVGGVEVNSPSSVAGQYEAAEGGITTPLSVTGPITGDLQYVGTACSEVTTDLTDKIAFIDRGGCSFTLKLQNAKAAGAMAAVVANSQDGEPIVMGGTNVELPGVMVSKATGTKFKNAGGVVNITLSDSVRIPKPELADTIASFSSKGPGRSAIGFKPEVSAPGYNIDSAAFGTGDASSSKSGTSMAAPHVAGVAALLRQLHPDWSVDEIKSLIMNTSTPIQDLQDNVYPLSRQGAGRVQANVAANTTGVVYPQALSLGYVPVSEEVKVQKNKEVKVTNKGTQAKEYTVTWENRHGDQTGPVSLSLPGTLKVDPGASKTLKVNFAITSAELSDAAGFHEFDGYVVLTDKSGEVLRVPYQAVVEKVSALKAKANSDSLKLNNVGATSANTELFEFGGSDAVEASIEDYQDLVAVGVRAEGGVAEFVVATEGAWENPVLVEFDVYIDTNKDGIEDFIVFNYDLGLITGAASPSGRQVTALYNVATGKLSLQYYVSVGGSYNQNYMGLPVSLSAIGVTGDFQYQVASFADGTDVNDGGWITFNTAKPNISFDSSSLDIAAGATEQVKVSLNAKNAKAMIVNNADATVTPYTLVDFNLVGNNGKVTGNNGKK